VSEVQSFHDSSAGRVEIEFGINRWVLVAVGPEQDQEQIDTDAQLADFLRRRGVPDEEAVEIAETAWAARPEDATVHAVKAREGRVAATGLTAGALVLMFVGFAVVFFWLK
jgi:hypothetical protein